MKKAWSSLCFFLLIFNLQAQEIEEILYKKGFENIQILEEEDTLKVFFEHREFRNPFHSMEYATLLLREVEKPIEWIPLHHNTLVGSYTENYRFRDLSPAERNFFKSDNDLAKGYRFHFRIHPDFSARFGYYTDPFQIKFNMILDTRIYLARGLSLQTGIRVPVKNNLDTQDMQPRLAPSMLHYFSQPLNSHFLAMSAGTFYFDRYGLDLQYRYAPLDSRWGFGLESGVTGFYRINSGSYFTEKMDDLHAVADVEYRLPFENLSAKLSAGRFLFKDTGVRADLIKQFSSSEFGLHVAATDSGVTGGFQFAFSLWPGTIIRSNKLELRTTEELRWEYSYNNEDSVARSYRIGIPRLADVLRQYNSNFRL